MAWSNESAYKTALVKDARAAGAYARRIEDQYGVGILDMVFVVPGLGAVFAEAKLVRAGGFAATPRQRVEAERIARAGGLVCLLGYDRVSGDEFISRCTDERVRTDRALRRQAGEGFAQFLERYFNGGRS